VAQRVGRGIALLFHDRSALRPHFTQGKDPVPILHEAGWALGPVWTGRKSCPHRDSFPDRPPCSHYRLSYPASDKLMLYIDIIAVCSEIHATHINALSGQNVDFFLKY